MNIAFVTNGSNDIGYGHISRTLLLCSFFKSKKLDARIFVPKSCPFELESDVIRVNSFAKDDLDAYLSCYNVVIIDSIEEDYDKLSWTKGAGLFIVTITLFMFDVKKRFEHLSFYPSIDDAKCLSSSGLKLFVGRDYLTFRSEFSHVRFVVKENAKNIIVAMGGTDPVGLTMRVLKSIAHDARLCITILLSEVSADYDTVLEHTKLYPNISLVKFTNNVAQLFSQHDIALINGGLTRYETCIIGIPFLALSIHKQQFNITQQFVDRGIGVNIGVHNQVSERLIYSKIVDLLNDYERRRVISLRMKSLFDTKGVERIYNIVKEEYYSYEKNDQMG